jgi:hypothetical protein
VKITTISKAIVFASSITPLFAINAFALYLQFTHPEMFMNSYMPLVGY